MRIIWFWFCDIIHILWTGNSEHFHLNWVFLFFQFSMRIAITLLPSLPHRASNLNTRIDIKTFSINNIYSNITSIAFNPVLLQQHRSLFSVRSFACGKCVLTVVRIPICTCFTNVNDHGTSIFRLWFICVSFIYFVNVCCVLIPFHRHTFYARTSFVRYLNVIEKNDNVISTTLFTFLLILLLHFVSIAVEFSVYSVKCVYEVLAPIKPGPMAINSWTSLRLIFI